MDYQEEFHRQIQNLIDKGYHDLMKMSKEDFRITFVTLESKLVGLKHIDVDLENGKLPFVIVIKSDLIPASKMMSLTELNGKSGNEKMTPKTPEYFKPIDSAKIPDGNVYLLYDIDRGKESLNVRPGHAIKVIQEIGRTPLTIDEGIALITHFPDFLMKNNCFSLLASRGENKMVPAIWIDGEKHPKLGWCWNMNPHTWLGSASAARRI